MEITVKNRTRISGLEKEQVEQIKEKLTISNPLFYKKLDMNLYHWDTPQTLKYYLTPSKGEILIPVGATNDILTLIRDEFGVPEHELDYKDERFTSDKHSKFFNNLEFLGQLRDYQQQTHDVCMQKTIGVVEAMTGSGKTVIFTSMIVSRKQPTLILVNTKDLAQQTIDAICEFTNAEPDDIGFVGSGKFDLKPISVGIHQTLSGMKDKEFDKLNDYFGQIIADEVHIVAAETFYNNMCKLDAKYKFGFSATPEREDGLTEVIHFASGPLVHKVEEEDIKKYITVPTYRHVATNYHFFLVDTQEFQMMLTDLCEDEERNKLILEEVRKNIDSYSCLLCRRTSQVEHLAEQLGDNAVALTSQTKDREGVMQLIKSKEKNILVSTFGLMSTGIDVPHFDKMYFCAPIKSKIKIRQSVGRLMRKDEGKSSAEVIDFVDFSVDLLKHQFFVRKKIIDKLLKSLR